MGVYEPVRYCGKLKLIAKKYLTAGQSAKNNLRKPPPTSVAIIIPIDVDVFLTKTETINEIVPTTIETNHPRNIQELNIAVVLL